jgi:hypothetical protein
MKLLSLFSILCLIFSTNSFANANRVGDQISLRGNFAGGSLEINGSYVSYQGSSMLQRTVTYLNGQNVGTEDSWLADEDILTPESAGLMVALCPNIGGVHEYLELPVGRTLTCRMDTQALTELPYIFAKNLQALGDKVWLAPFPVLGVAQIQVDGAYLQVQSYTWK